MRHSLDYGLLNATQKLTDEEIAKSLPKAALAELEKTGGRKTHPASFLVKQVVDEFNVGTEFTVNDVYIMIHKDAKDLRVKMATLRTTLANLSRKEGSNVEVAEIQGKHRLYVKVDAK